ncbi:MAG: hypothetical protein IPM15_16860 [Betaproteobacteria bacterium]|nr:hypothetical protein [Betaproteobacteria bacterium]MCL4698179.1 hypothetical protein [Burkholderiaceae bacterium]
MVRHTFHRAWRRGICTLTLLAAATIGHAQGTPGGAARADPLDAQARVPALTYRSPLDGYRRLGDDKPVSWQQANETVNRIGGWRAYARQAQQPEAAASAPPGRGAPAQASDAGPAQGGHGKDHGKDHAKPSAVTK